MESAAGKTMVSTSPDGPLAVMVTNVTVDKHAGEVATGRVYGGTVQQGSEVYLVGSHAKSRVQQVGVYFGPERVPTETVPAGNIVYITGAKGATAGETICSPDAKIKEFEGLDHISEPVVTVAVEAKNTKDLPKLIEVLRQTAKEDPTVHVNINEETGEHLISGMGELHLEVIGVRINNKGVDIKTSEPIVVYRETVAGRTASPVEGKSPNKHNRLYLEVSPLEDEMFQALQNGDIKEGKIKSKEEAQQFMDHGLDKEEAEEGFLEALPGRSLEETLEMRIVQVLGEARDSAGVIAEEFFNMDSQDEEGNLDEDNMNLINHSVVMARTGARASLLNLAQISACVGQQSVRGGRIERGYLNRPLPHFKKYELGARAKGFVHSSYKEGLDPIEFFFHAMGGREGLVDTAIDDPVVKAIGAEEGDVLQITRDSETAGTFVTYRFVNGFRNDK